MLTEKQIAENEEQIKTLLLSVDSEGMCNLYGHMRNRGFFTAPCSSQYHLACEGGLAQHSLNVYRTMIRLAVALFGEEETAKMMDSIKVCALLHDLGKMGDDFKPNYVPNMVRSKTKNKETGEYDMVQSTSKPYETNKDLLYIPHEVRSLMIIERFAELTDDEKHAIYYHNGKYTHTGYDLKETPLQMLLHFADLWCAKYTEVEPE